MFHAAKTGLQSVAYFVSIPQWISLIFLLAALSFDPCEYLDTDEALLGRAFNRPKVGTWSLIFDRWVIVIENALQKDWPKSNLELKLCYKNIRLYIKFEQKMHFFLLIWSRTEMEKPIIKCKPMQGDQLVKNKVTGATSKADVKVRFVCINSRLWYTKRSFDTMTNLFLF